ncbi:MAG TPA: hypothetical protein PKI20_19750 [Verrucomicrobiota bacterium]|nr:hypothetical protein [Verrucomicrobiota bacterium]HQL80033.1 hypothetical protein [Verrucomicrobiota bacterium]
MIRLNLLAEAKAAEETRRRDPVKRSLWLAGLIVALILAWSSSLQLKSILDHSEVGRLEATINSHSSEYQLVLDNQTRTADIKGKLAGLRQLSANRLLNGTLLNALQQTTFDEVQLLRLRVEQLYTTFAGTKARTNESGVFVPGKPATATENTLLTLEGADSAFNPGDGLNKYREALARNPYFKQVLVKTNGITLKSLAAPEISALTGKRSVIFTLECHYPEITR